MEETVIYIVLASFMALASGVLFCYSFEGGKAWALLAGLLLISSIVAQIALAVGSPPRKEDGMMCLQTEGPVSPPLTVPEAKPQINSEK